MHSPLSSIVKDTQTMRKLAARSITVALLAVLVSGCSSSGGKKSFSWSSLNPMTYFAKSDSDSPVPKPTDQIAPTVTLPSASDVASAGDVSGGVAPPSPWGGAKTSLSDTRASSSSVPSGTLPQQGRYDPNGYAGGTLPLSPSSSPYDQSPYAAQSAYNSATGGNTGYQAPGSGYYPASPAYDATPPAQYAVGGTYDIQDPTAANPGLPAYASPAAPYGNNASPYSGSTPYQSPPLSSPSSGYDTGLAQDPYGATMPAVNPGAASNNATAPWAAGATPADPYRNAPYTYPGDSANLGTVASLPQTAPLPSEYQNTQTPYQPGNTGYLPPNVAQYTPPSSGGYVQPTAATELNYAPGSVSRYPSASSQAGATGTVGSNATSGSYY